MLYLLSESKLLELQKQINVLTDSRRIILSSSLYEHPIIQAKTKGRAGLRMCVDYHTLNSNTIIDAWLLPHINKLLERLWGAKVFSKLNLRDGYHQIPVELKDHYKMAFSCRSGSFEFTVMQFGFKNAPNHLDDDVTLVIQLTSALQFILMTYLSSKQTRLSMKLTCGKYLIDYIIKCFT